MSRNLESSIPSEERIFTKETLINGKAAEIECIEIRGQAFYMDRGGLIAVARLEDEWCESVDDPDAVIGALKESVGFAPDIFTFWQRLPNSEPKYSYYMEWDNVAALRIESYEHWWNHQIQSNTRGHVRKAEKKGVVIREANFTDDFVQGMVDIFNETPVRQNRQFWHYGKDFNTIKREFSRYLFREQLLGAYYQDELIGFIMLADAGEYAILGQIISKIKHRDKNPTNALIAKAVEICTTRNIPYLVYAHWPSGPLADFKRQNGFEKIDLPRYYIPLSWKGRLALKYGFHHSWKERVPESIKEPMKRLRRMWNELRKK
jgi:hypothetical protein